MTTFDPSDIVCHWECDLATETLRWSDETYDLFDLPRGSALDRGATVALYEPESRIEMECLRTAAIRDKTGFMTDACIRTAAGEERWIRIVARVVCEDDRAIRLVGTKTDVTQERWASPVCR